MNEQNKKFLNFYVISFYVAMRMTAELRVVEELNITKALNVQYLSLSTAVTVDCADGVVSTT